MRYRQRCIILPVHQNFLIRCKTFRSEQVAESTRKTPFTGLDHEVSGPDCQIKVFLRFLFVTYLILLPCSFKQHET
jgi:hypothetical protein